MRRSPLALLALLPLLATAQERVAVVGGSLSDARALYASVTSVPRDDCDPVGDGRWVCASFDNPTLADARRGPQPVAPLPSTPVPSAPAPSVPTPSVPTPSTPAPSTPAPSTPAPVPSAPPAVGIAVVGRDLGDAQNRYAAASSQPRIDCDPAGDGRWVCASFENPTLSDAGDALPVTPPVPDAGPAPARPEPVDPRPTRPASLKVQAEDLALAGDWRVESERSGHEGAGYAIWRGPDLFSSPGSGLTDIEMEIPSAGEYQLVIRARAVSPDRPDLSNDTFFRFPGGEWTKVFTTGQDSWETGGTGDRDDEKFPFRARLQAGTVTLQMSGRSTRHAIDFIELQRVGEAGAPAVPPIANRSGDLVVLHYDSSYDYDDQQAMVAARHVMDRFPERDVLAVNGTRKYSHDGVTQGSYENLRALFPSALDALNDSDAETKAATAWQMTLEAGYRVQVAEGGTSDFTARVLGILQQRGVGNLKNISVVQHSNGPGGWNEKNTRTDNMALVRELTTYTPIDNGNDGGNGTAELFQNSDEFERRALASEYGAQWRNAFGYVADPTRRHDFSDTVALLHILGEPNNGGVIAFADRYFQAAMSTSDSLLRSTGVAPQRTPDGLSWADSYIGTDGQCYPATTFDHGIGASRVTTGSGERITIRDAVSRLEAQGRFPARQDDLAFNQISCNADYPNMAGDEDLDQCPGLVTRGRAGCEFVATVPVWWDRL